jgi:hypothetical protein
VEHQYSHHHLQKAHHAGLAIGTIIGSLAVTALFAIAAVITSGSLVTGSIGFGTNIAGADTSVQEAHTGLASQSKPVLPGDPEAMGAAAQSINALQ